MLQHVELYLGWIWAYVHDYISTGFEKSQINYQMIVVSLN